MATQAQGHVEARSLSAINNLAAHPPQYPINPVERHETLTLYISRVPGSRDIILSTFKPQRKNVTGEDVANSLYYVHLDQPTDELLTPKTLREPGSPRSSSESAPGHDREPLKPIARKPLPSSAKVPPLRSHVSDEPPRPPQHGHHASEQVKYPPLQQPVAKENMPPEQKAVSPTAANFAVGDKNNSPTSAPPPPPKLHLAPSQVPRKPLGPRPMSRELASINKELPEAPKTIRPSTPPTPEASCPPLPPRPSLQSPRPFTEFPIPQRPQVAVPLSPSRSPSPGRKHKPFTPFCLSIIRRDPSSGHQWNIGKVSSYQSNILLDEPSSPDGPQVVQYPRGYPAINVVIETSGYARFRGFPTSLPQTSLDGPPGSSSSMTARSLKELASTMAGEARATDSDEFFSRQVVMAYGKRWTHNLKEAFSNMKQRERSSTNASATDDQPQLMPPLEPPRAPAFHRRQGSDHSDDSLNSANSAGNNNVTNLLVTNPASPVATLKPGRDRDKHWEGKDPSLAEPLITQPGSGLRPKGYVFASPWDGRCEFHTSSNGRALKCRHVRNTTSQGFNPLVAAQALRDGLSSEGGDGGTRGRSRGMSESLAASILGSVPVSELRFNLPTADLFHSKEDRERAARELKGELGRVLRIGSPEADGTDGAARRPGTAEDDEDDEPIFDFSGLGRERAGGGNRGKRAKLGKLLVHDEGIKMLDLVIAANMGIWWQAWERSF